MFELLQIKSDLWNSRSSNSDEGECSSKKSTETTTKFDAGLEGKDDGSPVDKEFLLNLENLVVKKERNMVDDDDEREEGEIQDADEEIDCGRLSSRRRSSSNPVNLSLNTKCGDSSDSGKDKANTEDDLDTEVSI